MDSCPWRARAGCYCARKHCVLCKVRTRSTCQVRVLTSASQSSQVLLYTRPLAACGRGRRTMWLRRDGTPLCWPRGGCNGHQFHPPSAWPSRRDQSALVLPPRVPLAPAHPPQLSTCARC